MSRSRLRWTVGGFLALALSTVPAAAAADDGVGLPPYRGVFVDANVPVYAETGDGWSCQFLGQCRTEARTLDDPAAAWRSSYRNEPIDAVVCRRGSFYLIEQGARRGWAPMSGVASRKVWGCGAFDW